MRKINKKIKIICKWIFKKLIYNIVKMGKMSQLRKNKNLYVMHTKV